MTQFRNLTTTKIGDIAEAWAVEYLESNGYSIYWNTGHKSQIWDGIGFSGTTVRNLIEVKAKYPTEDGTFSIHENDLEKYEEWQINEGKQMIILYVDHKNKELKLSTTKMIRKNTIGKWFDAKEHKWLIFHKGYKVKAQVPDEVCERMWSLSKQIQK